MGLLFIAIRLESASTHWWTTSTHRRTSASHWWATMAVWAKALAASVGFFSLLKRSEPVSQREHAVTAERIIYCIFYVACRDVAIHVFALSKYVIHRNHHRSLLVFQELIGYRAIPNPLLCVVAGRVARCGAIAQVGAQHQAEWRAVSAVELSAIGVYVAVIAHCRLHRVVRGLEVVARTYLKVKHIGAVSKSGRVIYRECLAAVIGVVVVTFTFAVSI